MQFHPLPFCDSDRFRPTLNGFIIIFIIVLFPTFELFSVMRKFRPKRPYLNLSVCLQLSCRCDNANATFRLQLIKAAATRPGVATVRINEWRSSCSPSLNLSDGAESDQDVTYQHTPPPLLRYNASPPCREQAGQK